MMNGEVLTSEEVNDAFLVSDDDLDKWQNMEVREHVILMHLDAFKAKMDRFFSSIHPRPPLEYHLVFQSKMHTTPDNETDNTSELNALPS